MQDIRVKAEWDGFAGLIERLDQLQNHRREAGGRASPRPAETAVMSALGSTPQSQSASQDLTLKKTLSALEAELRAYERRKPKTALAPRRPAEAHARRSGLSDMPGSQAVDLEFVKLALEFSQFAQSREPGLKGEIELLRGELGAVASRIGLLCDANSKQAESTENAARLFETVQAISQRMDELASAKPVNSFTKRLSAIESQLNLLASTISHMPSPLYADIARDVAFAIEGLKSKLDAKFPAASVAAQDLDKLKLALLEKLTQVQTEQDEHFALLEEAAEKFPKTLMLEIRGEIEKAAGKFDYPAKLEAKLNELRQGLADLAKQSGGQDPEIQIAREIKESISRLCARQETDNSLLRQSLGNIEAEIQKAVSEITRIKTGLGRPSVTMPYVAAQPVAIPAIELAEGDTSPDCFSGASLGLIDPGHGSQTGVAAVLETRDLIGPQNGVETSLARFAAEERPLAEFETGLSRQDFIAAARRASRNPPLSGLPLILPEPYHNGTPTRTRTGLSLLLRLKQLMRRIQKPSGLTLLALLILGVAYSRLEDEGRAKSLDQAQVTSQPGPASEAPRPKPASLEKSPAAEARPQVPARSLVADVFDQTIYGPNLPGQAHTSPMVLLQPMAGADKIAAATLQPSVQTLVIAAHQDTAKAGASHEFLELKEQADAGNSAAQYAIAQTFASGQGAARDYKQAMEYFARAASQGLAPAQFRLASIYEKGLGTDKNVEVAASWYQRAAEAGNVHAMHNLGVLLAEGLDGRPDYAKAAFWFAQAAAYGEGDSQFNLAVLLGRGLGVSQDLAKSYAWFAIAAAPGDAEAAKKRDDTGARLSMSDVQTAKKFAQTYLARPRDRLANEVEIPSGGLKSLTPIVAKNSDF